MHDHEVTPGWAIWITGRPGSGKSVLARAAAEALRARGAPVAVLELDAIRKVLTPAPTYRDGEREAVHRLLALMAATLVEAGVPVIVDATAHRRQWRQLARERISCFAEVQLECPLAVCRERKAPRGPGNARPGISARAGAGVATVPGVDREYEPALAPELVIDTTADSVGAGAEKIAALAERLAAASPARLPRPGGWAVWITGRPGSGKTTIACRMAERLAGHGVTVRIIEPAGLRRLVAPILHEGLDDLVHRAVVCLAKLLVDAGVGVIIDATAHHRRWRELGRSLIPRFAEIQLECPADVCADRERATRWRLGGGAGGPVRPATATDVELVLDYEPALAPDLIVYTDVQDCAAAVDEVLFVAERLHRHAEGLKGD
jgi:adenylylsulfate kinase